MAEKRSRRKFSAEEKAVILRRHLQDKVPVSDLCDEYSAGGVLRVAAAPF